NAAGVGRKGAIEIDFERGGRPRRGRNRSAKIGGNGGDLHAERMVAVFCKRHGGGGGGRRREPAAPIRAAIRKQAFGCDLSQAGCRTVAIEYLLGARCRTGVGGGPREQVPVACFLIEQAQRLVETH